MAQKTQNLSKQLSFLKALVYISLFFSFPVFSNTPLQGTRCPESFSESNLKIGNAQTIWMSFHETQQFVEELGIKTRKEFLEFAASEDRPEDLPANPSAIYEEWTSWNDFLGITGTEIANNRPLSSAKSNGEIRKNTEKTDNTHTEEWMTFLEAKAFIQRLGIRSQREFNQWSKSGIKPHNFPPNPHIIYRKDWISLGEFLGINRMRIIKPEWMSYHQAKEFIQTQGITSAAEFNKWKKSGKKPYNFPLNPRTTYSQNWNGWNEFLGINWMPFQEAKAFIQNQGITSISEFREWKKSGQKPLNFPANPNTIYKENWNGWKNFLGISSTPRTHTKEWMPFQEAKAFIQNQGITSISEFREWKKSGQKPLNFPANPNTIYKENWNGWKNFLGISSTPRTHTKEWMPFQEAKAFIQNQGITSISEFREWKKSGQKPLNFPANPNTIYKENWNGWKNFLGISGTPRTRTKKWMPFQEAKTFIQNQGITSFREFQEWKKAGNRPYNFPSNPRTAYAEKWSSWGDFLGTGNTHTKEWMSYTEAKTFIQNQGITSETEFYQWAKSEQRPHNFPSTPHKVYNEEWKGWGDFLGTGNTHTKEWMSYTEAKTFIQNQGITSSTEFFKWSKSKLRPQNFPANPNKIYKEEWRGWSDFLGTHNTRTKKWMSFQKAKTFIQNQGITSETEFRKWKRDELRPQNFPSNPHTFYEEEWRGWGDFLGTGNIKNINKEWMSYEEAKQFIQNQDITSAAELNKWSKLKLRPHNFPTNPSKIYQEEWNGWGDFLGTDNTNTKTREWMSYEKAKTFIRNQGITSSTEFFKWSKSKLRPQNFPADPNKIYQEEWNGWKVFLGTAKKPKNKAIHLII